MSLSSKREYLAKIHGRYQRAGRPHKSRILDEFCLNCGYHRKAALRLLHRPLGGRVRKRSGPKVIYDPAVLLPVLKAVWLASDQLCSKLLKPALPNGSNITSGAARRCPKRLRKNCWRSVRRRLTGCCNPCAYGIRAKGFRPPGPARCCGGRCRLVAARPTPANPVRSRPTRWPIAATPRRAITSIP